MTLSGFVAYIKQLWANKPSTSSPLSAERLNHMEEGIKANSDGITKIVTSVTDQVVNDSNKIPSAASLYSVKQVVDKTNSDFTNSTFSIAPINKSILEGNTSDIFDWKSITVTGTYLLTCSIKKFDTTAADIQIFKNDETSPVKTGSNNVLIATLFLSAGDVIKIRAKSIKGTYTSYADQQFYFASLTFLSK